MHSRNVSLLLVSVFIGILLVNTQVESFENFEFRVQSFDKFIGKSNYVVLQLADHAQRFTDPEKFIGKSNYVVLQLADHAQRFTDPERFVGKANYVGEQITIQAYQSVDANNPTLLVLLLPFAGIILIKLENEKLSFNDLHRLGCFIFILVLLSSAVTTPFTY